MDPLRSGEKPPRTPVGASDPWRALRQLRERSYLVVDTETTGLLDPELVSIAIVSASGTPILNEHVRPARPIEPDAARITGLDAAAVRDKPEFPMIEPAVTRALEGRLVCMYNVSYDLSALTNTYGRYGLGLPPFETWCVMEWFARVYGDWNTKRGDYAWQPLAAAAAYFDVDQPVAHDALEDALTTWRILQAAIARGGFRVQGMEPLFDN